MKVVKKSQTSEHKNGEYCVAIEYPLDDKDLNAAVIELSGRYPTKGRVVNEVCKELAYIISGSCSIVFEDRSIELETGDLILIEPNEKYYWEGNAKLFVPCTPA